MLSVEVPMRTIWSLVAITGCASDYVRVDGEMANLESPRGIGTCNEFELPLSGDIDGDLDVVVPRDLSRNAMNSIEDVDVILSLTIGDVFVDGRLEDGLGRLECDSMEGGGQLAIAFTGTVDGRTVSLRTSGTVECIWC
jgi:hypothetical protein